MKNKFVAKIYGANPKGLLLAIYLARLSINVEISDENKQEFLSSQNKVYLINNSIIKLLEECNLWDRLQPLSNSINSFLTHNEYSNVDPFFSISDNSKINSIPKSIGWVVKHQIISEILFQELAKYKNISFIEESKEKYSAKNLNLNLFKFKKEPLKNSFIQFKIILRGGIKNRAYNFFRRNSMVALLPLNENVYHVNWIYFKDDFVDRLRFSKSFILDNLSVVIPKDLKIDQMIGDIELVSTSPILNILSTTSNKEKLLSLPLFNFYSSTITDISLLSPDFIQICNFLKKNIYSHNLLFFKFKFYFSRFILRSSSFLLAILIKDILFKDRFKFINKKNIFLKSFKNSIIFKNCFYGLLNLFYYL